MMSVFSRLTSWRERFRLRSLCEETPHETALIPRAMLSMLEDILSWENPQLSLGFVAFVNVLFLVFIQMNLSFTECFFIVGMMYICLDGVEMWLRHKHRTSCLEKLAQCDHVRLQNALSRTARWLNTKKDDFIAMREANPTKAFLVANIVLGILFVVGKAISGVWLLYLVSMVTILYPVYGPYVHRFANKIHQAGDSDAEIENMIPELSEQNMKELNIETESVSTRQSVEPWLPEGSPGRALSDSDEDSHSSGASLPHGDASCLEPGDSDSSDDQYLPKSETQLVSSMRVMPPARAWGGDAVSAVWNLGGTLTQLVYSAQSNHPAPATPSADSSDDFEFVDQSDL